MGAAEQMPVSDTSSVRSKEHDPFQRMMRLILGYVLAVAAGSIIFTLPSGLIAAYLFRAIGLGYGFGKWRPDVGAS
jgi:hypothetical protein